MLEITDVSFRYTSASPWLFRNLNLTVAPGEIVGLQGPSGQGKTTLARLIGGYLAPSKGAVTINGAKLSADGFCRVQLLFQHPELAVDPRWKIRSILAEGYSPRQAQLDDFDIQADWLDRYPCEMSGGQLARISLVRALGPDVEYLIADEITSMLDALTQARIWRSLIRYSKHHRIGMLVISHDSALLKRLCPRTIHIVS
jgi:peptide/nickel transport system ATP-binding protein